MNDEIVVIYWMAVILLDMLMEMDDDIAGVAALSITVARLSRELDLHGINPDDYEIDITITHTTDIDDSAFTGFVNSLDLGD